MLENTNGAHVIGVGLLYPNDYNELCKVGNAYPQGVCHL